jgi:vacuolar-type H+-ATPase subunit H
MDISNVIDRLDALVNTSSKLPTSRNRIVDADKIMELVEQLRLSIPQDIRAAQEVIERKDAILNQAQIDARRTRSEAEDEYRARLDQNELIASARQKSESLLEDAEQRANSLIQRAEVESKSSRTEADAYVVQSLRTLEKEMSTVLGSVRRGLDSLGATVQI